MTDYTWLTNPKIEGEPTIRVETQSVPHYRPGGWVETDPVPELTAADIEAAEAAAKTAETKEQEPPSDVAPAEAETTEEE